jgi:hypothetical protein
MRCFTTLTRLLAASLAFANATEPTESSLVGASTISRRHLRGQHGGVADHDDQVASDAGIPGYVKAAPASMVSAPNTATGGNTVGISALAPQTQTITTPGSSTTSVNVTPGTVNTNVNITPGTSTTTISGGPPEPAPAPQGMPKPQQPRPVQAPAAKASTSTSGHSFGFDPLKTVATLAHEAHGMLLGHTGTLPSSYMQSKSGGGGGTPSTGTKNPGGILGPLYAASPELLAPLAMASDNIHNSNAAISGVQHTPDGIFEAPNPSGH